MIYFLGGISYFRVVPHHTLCLFRINQWHWKQNPDQNLIHRSLPFPINFLNYLNYLYTFIYNKGDCYQCTSSNRPPDTGILNVKKSLYHKQNLWLVHRLNQLWLLWVCRSQPRCAERGPGKALLPRWTCLLPWGKAAATTAPTLPKALVMSLCAPFICSHKEQQPQMCQPRSSITFWVLNPVC